jgi:enterochelin esterase-like enzyme
MLPSGIKIKTHQIESAFLKRTVELDLYVPKLFNRNDRLHLLLLNDGQEAEALQVQATIDRLYTGGAIEAVVVVAIKASENRLQEYGVAGVPDFQQRGDQAMEYSQFITKELLSYLYEQLALPITGKTAFAGFSLGGLSAFDIVYNHPELFELAGVFSGAFWWRKKDINAGYMEGQDRIVHQMIRNSAAKPAVKFWLMTGTEDEKDDRNNNYIIDSIDDTIDVIKELVNKGFQRPAEVFYYEVVGGKHEPDTWAKAFPAFLTWAFPGRLSQAFS